MPQPDLEQTLRNVDARLAHVEQILPTLATRDAMRGAIADAIAPLATREELHAAVALLATKQELREGLDAARRHATLLSEDLRDDIRIVLEHVIALSSRVDDLTRRLS